MAPKLKFVRPGTGSVGLDDLQFFEPFIPLAVSPSNHVFGFLVGRCEVAQRHFFLAVGEDLIEMFPDQECKALESIHPAPFQGVDPSSEKLDAHNRQHSQDAEVGWDACACVSGGWFSHRWSAQTRLRAGVFLTQRRAYRSRMRPALSANCGSRGKIEVQCCPGWRPR